MSKWDVYGDVRDAEFKHRQEARKHRKARTERRELAQARKAVKR